MQLNINMHGCRTGGQAEPMLGGEMPEPMPAGGQADGRADFGVRKIQQFKVYVNIWHNAKGICAISNVCLRTFTSWKDWTKWGRKLLLEDQDEVRKIFDLIDTNRSGSVKFVWCSWQTFPITLSFLQTLLLFIVVGCEDLSISEMGWCTDFV